MSKRQGILIAGSVALIAVIVCVFAGIPDFANIKFNQGKIAAESVKIIELPFRLNGRYNISKRPPRNLKNDLLDPFTFESINKQKQYADLIYKYADFDHITRKDNRLHIPLQDNNYKIRKLELLPAGELYSADDADYKKLTIFTGDYYKYPTLFRSRHVLPVKIIKKDKKVVLQRLTNNRPEVIYKSDDHNYYLIKLQHKSSVRENSLIIKNVIPLPLPRKSDQPDYLQLNISDSHNSNPDDAETTCNPCQIASGSVCLPYTCPSGRTCEVINGQESCTYCGDNYCQTQYESCIDCPSDCAGSQYCQTEEPTATETTAECSIIVEDLKADEGEEVNIKIEPSYPANINAILSEIKIKAEPKTGDFTNAAKVENKKTEPEFEYFPSENRAVGRNFLWFGYGQNDSLCLEDFFDGEQGKYNLKVTATFDDGCIAEKTAILDVAYPSRAGFVSDFFSIGAEFDFEMIESKDLGGNSWYVCGKYVCSGDNCLQQDSAIMEDHPSSLQYHTIAMREEGKHVDQGKGLVEWPQGGNSYNGVKVASSANFIKYFLPEKVCGVSIKSREAAWDNATYRAERHVDNVFDYFSTYYDRWLQLKETRCWVEYTAKEAVELKKNYAGFHYECTYVKDMDCQPNPAQPDFFWKWLESQPKPPKEIIPLPEL